MQVFAWMDFVANVNTLLFRKIEDRLPAPRQFIESRLDETGGALGPWIDEGPGERTGKGRMCLDAKMP